MVDDSILDLKGHTQQQQITIVELGLGTCTTGKMENLPCPKPLLMPKNDRPRVCVLPEVALVMSTPHAPAPA